MRGLAGTLVEGKGLHDLYSTVEGEHLGAKDTEFHRRRDNLNLRHVASMASDTGSANVSRETAAQAALKWRLQHVLEALERETELTRALQEKVERRSAELNEANAELQEFANTIAHDLRAPLRGISGFATALLEDEGARLSDLGRHHAERIASAAHKMDGLIQDLLMYNRIARSEAVLAPTSINSVLALVLQDLDAEIRFRGARISVQPAMPKVLAVRPLLQQVLRQLLDNALKFVALAVVPEISITGEEHASRLRVIVADNGIGIAAKYHERIFRPFERLHGEDAYRGNGIGLAVVRRALNRMGGRVGVESTRRGGSRFWFELALAQSDA